MALLWGAGVRGNSLEAIAAWKEGLLAIAVARVAWDAWRTRKLPFRPGPVEALAFAAVVLLYAVIPQSALGGAAGAKAILYGIRHDIVPVVAYFLGRSAGLGRLRSIAWTLLGAAATVSVFGLVEEYAAP